MNTTLSSPNIIAVDVGYGNTKVVCGYSRISNAIADTRPNTNPAPSAQPVWTEASFPSVVRTVDSNDAGMELDAHEDRIVITHQGKRYLTGKKASSSVASRIKHTNYIESTEHELLLRTAIHLAMRESGRVITHIDTLVLGLPVSGYKAHRARLKTIGLQQRTVPVPKRLQRGYGAAEVSVFVHNCLVLPQPMGAMRLAAEQLPLTDGVFQEGACTMVVDPGYRTLDWFVTEAMLPDMANSGSYDGGVSGLLQQIANKLAIATGKGRVEADAIDKALQTGSLQLDYQPVDMKPYQDMLPGMVEAEVAAFLNHLDARRSQIKRLIVTGGGAHYFEQALRTAMPVCHVSVLDDPVMSNARGYWLYASK